MKAWRIVFPMNEIIPAVDGSGRANVALLDGDKVVIRSTRRPKIRLGGIPQPQVAKSKDSYRARHRKRRHTP